MPKPEVVMSNSSNMTWSARITAASSPMMNTDGALWFWLLCFTAGVVFGIAFSVLR